MSRNPIYKGVSWNPMTGCTKVSPGCKNCYAERMARHLKSIGSPTYKNGFKLTFHEKAVEYPLRLKKPHRIFISSMSDLFQEGVPSSYIEKIFDVMNRADWHVYMVLTKRSSRLLELSKKIRWTSNILMGVTVENNDYICRIDDLKKTGAYTKYINFEPLLGAITDLDLTGIDWVLVGGESGVKARAIRKSWVTDIKNRCIESNTPFFFKQWGGTDRKKSSRLLDGKLWEELPEISALKKDETQYKLNLI